MLRLDASFSACRSGMPQPIMTRSTPSGRASSRMGENSTSSAPGPPAPRRCRESSGRRPRPAHRRRGSTGSSRPGRRRRTGAPARGRGGSALARGSPANRHGGGNCAPGPGQLVGEEAAPVSLLQPLANLRHQLQGAQERDAMRHADQPSQPGQVSGRASRSIEHPVGAFRHVGKVKDEPGGPGIGRTATTGKSRICAICLRSPGRSLWAHDGTSSGGLKRSFHHRQFGAASSPHEQGPANRVGHQPRIEVATRQARDLPDQLRGGRTSAGSEMLNPVLPGQSRQQGECHDRGFRSCGRCRESQPRNVHHRCSEIRGAGLVIGHAPDQSPRCPYPVACPDLPRKLPDCFVRRVPSSLPCLQSRVTTKDSMVP